MVRSQKVSTRCLGTIKGSVSRGKYRCAVYIFFNPSVGFLYKVQRGRVSLTFSVAGHSGPFSVTKSPAAKLRKSIASVALSLHFNIKSCYCI